MPGEQYRRDLEDQLKSRRFKDAFKTLTEEHEIFDCYPSVDALCVLIKPGNKNYRDKNEMMRILLKALHEDDTVYPLVNVLFWESLERLRRRYAAIVADPEELFGRIQWYFYQAVMGHDPDRSSEKIDVNIFLNTKKKTVAWVDSVIKEREAVKELGALERAGLDAGDLGESQVPPEEMESYLLGMVYRDIITEMQYDLIVETLVYRRMNQREWAEKRGVSYNTVRNLRYRAEMAIMEHKRKKKSVEGEAFT